MDKKKPEIEFLMDSISEFDRGSCPGVFKVSLFKSDHLDTYTATAEMRQEHGVEAGMTISAVSERPETALVVLLDRLNMAYAPCPHCLGSGLQRDCNDS